MKTTFLSLLTFLAFHLGIHAQVISSINPTIGDVAVLSIEFTILDPGASGDGITWDFSQASFIGENVINVISLSDATSSDLFPDATHAFGGSFLGGDEDFFAFFDFNGGWSDLGQVTNDVGDVYTTIFSDPHTYFTTPLSATSSGSDTYASTLDLGFLNGTISGSSTWTVDGSGTLILPNATYTDVLRVRNEAVEILTPELFPIDIESTIITHMWLKDGIPFPLLQAVTTIEDFGGEIEEEFYATALISYSSGVSSVRNQQALNSYWRASPNPFQDQVRLSATKYLTGNVKISVLTVSGSLVKTVGTFNISNSKEIMLNMVDLPSGIYVISIEHDEVKSFQKVVKL